MNDKTEANVITKAFPNDCTIEEGERAVVAKISTVSVDRDGEVLIPQGCNTRDFEKNPIVFLNHNYYTLPIGKCTAIDRTDKAIIAKTVFARRPENHPEGEEWVPDTLFSLFQQGIIRSFSVGFQSNEYRPATQKDMDAFGKGCRGVHSKWSLLEYSVAPLPANQDAVATAVAKGLLSQKTARGLFGVTAGNDEPAPVIIENCKVRRAPEVVIFRRNAIAAKASEVDPLAGVNGIAIAYRRGRIYK